MPFKIVQTVENGELCLCVVPALWEQNGILSWPKKMAVARLCLDENSCPNSNWEKMNCVLKRELCSYAAAHKELDRMESIPDTEADDVGVVPSKPRKVRRKNENKKTSNVVKDFNEFLQTPQKNEDNIDEMMESLSDEASVTDKIACANEQEPVQPRVLTDSEQYPTSTRENVPKSQQAIVEEFEVHDVIPEATLSAVASNQVILYNNQLKMMATLAHLTSAIEALNKRAFSLNTVPATRLAEDKPFKPVGSVDELDRLEAELKDEATMQLYIEKLSSICGTEGKSNGGDCAFRLIDYVATREFIHLCSWTGAARDFTEEDKPCGSKDCPPAKIPLKFYLKFRELLLRVIRLADHAYSEASCEKFLKGIMKNSKARLTPKVLSTQKRRPCNLKYNKNRGPDGAEPQIE